MKIDGTLNTFGATEYLNSHEQLKQSSQITTEKPDTKSGNNSDNKQNQQDTPSKHILKSAINGMNQTAEALMHTHMKFTLHEGTHEYYVKIIDDSSGKVLREIPSKKFLDRVEEMLKFSGLFVNEKR